MLRHLHIENYALIDHLDIEFEAGFSVITGETGAGKSILLGAIGLLLGQRADSKNIKTGASRCIIEADFSLNDEEYTLRRVLNENGKSRVFINDEPANVSALKELGDRLIDIHSQHQNLLIARENFQLSVLDTLAQNATLLADYKKDYNAYRQTVTELEEAKAAKLTEDKEQDYMQFQFDQLSEAKLQSGEQEELEAEQQTLEHAEDIKTNLYSVSQILDEGEMAVIASLHTVQRKLATTAEVFPLVEELAQRIDSCYIEMKDIASEVEACSESVNADPQRLEKVTERLNTIYELQRKHHAANVDELLAIQADLEEKLNRISNRDEMIASLERKLTDMEKGLTQQAGKLTQSRQKASSGLEEGICQRLRTLGMPNIQFKVMITATKGLTATGADNVQFAFSANKSSALQPISQVASGGEIARIMLSLKAIMGNAMDLPTIIFDEIDTGVSGQIAEAMALIMQEMGTKGHRQVISITHLPQIAALGSAHYKVYKEDNETGTSSHIVRLSAEERVEEIAHMLSGATLTSAAIDNAKALLSQHS